MPTQDKSIFVVTFPLKTEKWQEDRIDKMLRMLTVWYNDKQDVLLSRYIHLSHSTEFKEAKDKSKRDFANYMQENGFSKFGIEKVFADATLSKSVTNEQMIEHGINSTIIQELAHRAWSAWEKKLFGQGKFIRTNNTVDTMKSRFHGGSITGFSCSLKDFTLTMFASKPHRHALFTIPFEVNRDSEYELFALAQEVRNIAITRKEIRGKQKYFVQFSFAGTPYNKGRHLGTGVVGIDPGPSKVAIVSDEAIKIIPLAASIADDERITARLRRKLDRSRRATNPQMYNEDGTTKKGERQRVFSHHYLTTKALLADRQRKLAEKRKIAHNELANEVLTMGNEFRVENNSFRSMQVRSKETTKNAKGKNNSKKRFGKSLANRAPAEFLTILENKIHQYANGVYIDIPTSTACTQYDFTNGEFTKHELKERTITTADGTQHDRDALAAFNMKFVQVEKVAGKKKTEKSKDNFDNESMAAFYPRFCQMENEM